jgi:MSHA pilin protein MshC
MRTHRPPPSGFTLVEVIVVMLLVGILGAVVGPRFFDLRDYQARRFYDQLQAGLRHAQAVAIAGRGKVQVDLDNVNAAARTASDCTASGTALNEPGTSNALLPAPPNGISLAVAGQSLPLKLCFNALGQPLLASTAAGVAAPSLDITVSGGNQALSLRIEQDTGFIH